MMISLWRTWMDAARFGMEAQQVMALRLMRLAGGGTAAATEANRMVAEKLAAGIAAQTAAVSALLAGGSLAAATRSAARPYRRRVRANRRRLGRYD